MGRMAGLHLSMFLFLLSVAYLAVRFGGLPWRVLLLPLIILPVGVGLHGVLRWHRRRQAATKAKHRAEKLKGITILDRPPHGLQFDARGRWHDIYLLTPDQLEALPKGTRLYTITGEEEIVGVDSIDDETRGGFTAYGFKAKDIGGNLAAAHAQEEADVIARLGHPIIDGPPRGMVLDPEKKFGDLYLITEKQLKAVPHGTRLYGFLGEVKIVGLDSIESPRNKDGFIEFGFLIRDG